MRLKPYLINTPAWIQKAYPDLCWRMDSPEPNIYLTFDDGPHPEITPWVLDQLSEYDQFASFFLIGDNVKRFPEVFEQLQKSEHSIGSHTMRHDNGWKTNNAAYYQSFEEADALINTNLFRPPYGRIKRSQISHISQTHRIIMWDVLSADFDVKLSYEECALNVIKNIRMGSIVVFHDSEKAWPRLEKALPVVLKHLQAKSIKSLAL